MEVSTCDYQELKQPNDLFQTLCQLHRCHFNWKCLNHFNPGTKIKNKYKLNILTFHNKG